MRPTNELPTSRRRAARGRRAAAALAIAIALVPQGSVAASPKSAWTEPFKIIKSDYNNSITADIADDGSAAMAWIKNSGGLKLSASVRDGSSGTWVDTGMAVRQYADDALVLVREGGLAAVVWMHERKLGITTWDGTSWSEPERVVIGQYGIVAQAAMNAHGEVAVAVEISDDVVLATRHDGGGWERHRLEDAQDTWAGDVAITDSGVVYAALVKARESGSPGSASTGLVLGRLGTDRTWTTTQLATPEGGYFLRDAQLATGPADEVAVTWLENADLGHRGQVVVWTPGDDDLALDRRLLRGSDQRGCEVYIPCARADFTADGDVVAVWTRRAGPRREAIRTATWSSADGRWSQAASVATDPTDRVAAQLDLRDDGSYVIRTAQHMIDCLDATSCEVLGTPDKWSPAGYNRFSFLHAGADGSAYLVYGDRECMQRCFGRPYWSMAPAG